MQIASIFTSTFSRQLYAPKTKKSDEKDSIPKPPMLLKGWSPMLMGILIIRTIHASPIEIINENQATPALVSSALHILPPQQSFTSAAAADIISSCQALLRTQRLTHSLLSTMKYLFSLIFMALASTSVPTAQAHEGHHDGDTTNPELVARLKMAATAKDRADLLPRNEDWLFDFRAQPSYTYSPGSVVSANIASFPAAHGHGLTVAMLSLGPCAMLSPHLHPRAANWVTAVEGTTKTWMIQENGVKPIEVVLNPGQMTIFPAGSLHTMQNMGVHPPDISDESDC